METQQSNIKVSNFAVIHGILLISTLLLLIDIFGFSAINAVISLLVLCIPLVIYWQGLELTALKIDNSLFWVLIILVCYGFSWNSYEFLSMNIAFSGFPKVEFFLYSMLLLMLTIGFTFLQDSISMLQEEEKKNIYIDKAKETFIFIISSVFITNFIFHLITVFGSEPNSNINFIYNILLKRGVIPIVIIVFFIWSLLIIVQSVLRTKFERDYFKKNTGVVAGNLGSGSDSWLSNYFKESFVKERLDFTSSLLNSRQDSSPAEMVDLLNESMKIQYQNYFSNYNIISYLAWVIPVLGFIGTVWGISQSIQEIVVSLSSLENEGMAGSTPNELLGNAVQPLAVAFDTTLLALSLSAVLMLLVAFIKRAEDRFFSHVEMYNQSMILSSLGKI